MKYTFWLNDISILYSNDQYLDFIPTKHMTKVQQLNALSRFSIYSILLLALFKKKNKYHSIPVILLAFAICLYYIYDLDPTGKNKERVNELHARELMTNTDYDQTNNSNKYSQSKSKDTIEAGIYDSNNDLQMGSFYSPHTKPKKKVTFTFDELESFKREKCQKPTPQNPFMNPSIHRFGTNDIKNDLPAACNSDNSDIKDKMVDFYNADLYRDISDLFNVKNSQRQFYTVPNTQVPNNQIDFAKWLYNTEGTCKDTQQNCLRYEDIRFKR
jgi:hypothetical protein